MALAQSYSFEVRHQHWRKGAMGTLRISPEEISFEEHGKKGKTDSRSWRYEEIQQLTVSPSELRILTYDVGDHLKTQFSGRTPGSNIIGAEGAVICPIIRMAERSILSSKAGGEGTLPLERQGSGSATFVR